MEAVTAGSASAREWAGTARRGFRRRPRPAVLWLLWLATHPLRRERPLRTRLADVAAVIGICVLVALALRLGDLLHVLAPHALGR